MATHSSPAPAPSLKAMLARVDERISRVESDVLPELRDQLGRALDRLTELTRKLEDQQRRNVSMDEFLSMTTRVARNEADIIASYLIR